MADKSLRGRLNRLFSTNVVVRRISKNRLKAVDTNRLQSHGNLSNKKYVDRFSGLHRGLPGFATSTYNQNASYHVSKIEMFTDYEAMDMDPIIASALDIYADESTTKDADGDVLTIKTANPEIQKILYNLFFDIMNVEYNLWPWIRNACKYGDFYLHLDIEEEIGVVNVVPLSAYEVRREEGFDPDNPFAYRFVLEGQNTYSHGSGTQGSMAQFESWQIAHFRLMSDTNFLPYGKSMIESARKIFKQLTLMEDAMLIHRIMRAPERRVFKIDVGNIPPNEVDNHIQSIINKMKKVPYIDERTGDYNLKFNMQNAIEDYFLPVRGDQTGTSIEALPGLGNDGQIEDIDYLKNKMFAALKVPKAFLGYDEGVEGKATLAAEDVRFARTIERIQRVFISELTKIAIIHLYSQGFTDDDLVDFELTLTNPSLVYERQQVETLAAKLSLATDMKDSGLFSTQWIYENIFKMSDTEWKYEQDQVIEDFKNDFRKEQIKSEGNDPKKTNMSFGTPHDIASMHVATKGELLPGQEQEYVGGTGRPPESHTWGTHKSDFTRDPLSIKDLSNTFKTSSNQLTTKSRKDTLSFESKHDVNVANIIDLMPGHKTKQIIKETMTTGTNDSESGLLDENQLLDD
jgi:hypothetical protein